MIIVTVQWFRINLGMSEEGEKEGGKEGRRGEREGKRESSPEEEHSQYRPRV